MAKSEIKLSFLNDLESNLRSSSKFIQVVLGPRQVGKTTGLFQLLETYKGSSLYVTSEEVIAPSRDWLIEKWQQALSQDQNCLLVIDEIQKVIDWAQTIKSLWDAQARSKNRIKLILLGSSSLHLQVGLEESLTGRFQLIRARHWNFAKSRELAKLDVDTFIKCGGYPGSYDLLKRPKTWESYLQDSIIETVIGKDILSFSKVRKPALFRQTFSLLSSYPAQEISYTKLLGQLQDSGNTDLVKHYVELFESAFLLKSIFKYTKRAVVKRSSSPKVIPLCGALIDRSVLQTKEGYGRALEAAVGAALVGADYSLSYWRDGDMEVDYVLEDEGKILAIEVKSGRKRSERGIEAFRKMYPKAVPVFLNAATIEAFLIEPRKFLARLS